MVGTPPSIFDCWLRVGGASTRFFKLQPWERSSPAERLLSALLSRDTKRFNQCANLLKECAKEFLDLVFKYSLANIVLKQLHKRNAQAVFAELNEQEHLKTIVAVLRRQCIAETLAYDSFDKKFCEFISQIGEMNREIIWLKGIVTSRTLCPHDEVRLSTDLDFFVLPSRAKQLETACFAAGYGPTWYDPAFCHQLEVGPTNAIEQCFISPAPNLLPSAVIGFQREEWPMIDAKFNPLDRGLRMVELDRFMASAMLIKWKSVEFKAPDLIDQLMITLVHYEKDRFESWKSLIDIGLLTDKINENPAQWDEFLRRCKVEGITTTCWASLSLAEERLCLQNVANVVMSLAAEHSLTIGRRLLFFTVTPLFYWNTSSLPMLILNAAVADDSKRKFEIIKSCISPSRQFMSAYYGDGKSMHFLAISWFTMIHWAVLFLPGGLVRRTFGAYLWPNDHAEFFKNIHRRQKVLQEKAYSEPSLLLF